MAGKSGKISNLSGNLLFLNYFDYSDTSQARARPLDLSPTSCPSINQTNVNITITKFLEDLKEKMSQK